MTFNTQVAVFTLFMVIIGGLLLPIESEAAESKCYDIVNYEDATICKTQVFGRNKAYLKLGEYDWLVSQGSQSINIVTTPNPQKTKSLDPESGELNSNYIILAVLRDGSDETVSPFIEDLVVNASLSASPPKYDLIHTVGLPNEILGPRGEVISINGGAIIIQFGDLQ